MASTITTVARYSVRKGEEPEAGQRLIAAALPWFTWLMLQYVKADPEELAGRIAFIEKGETIPLEAMAARYKGLYPAS